MKLTSDQMKKVWLLLGVFIIIAVALVLVQSFRTLIGARIPTAPDLNESVVGGRLKSDILSEGSHTLEFTARTNDSKIISDKVTFKVLPPDPYLPINPYLPPDPY